MKVYGCQFDITWENASANLARVEELLSRVEIASDSLIALPELFHCGFSMNVQAVGIVAGGPVEEGISNLARRHRSAVVAGIAHRETGDVVLNEAGFWDGQGRLTSRYAKMQPFAPGGEARHYTAGKTPCIAEWNGWRIATFVCYDLRFPEIFRQAAARQRPELYVVIANWPIARIAHWRRLLQARAIENQAYVLGVNRCGRDPNYVYSGASLIADYHGEILAEAGDGEEIVTADLNRAALEEYRTALPFLDDMRVVSHE